MKSYRFHYRTIRRGIKGIVNINADNFQEALRLFFQHTTNKKFSTFYVEFS